MRIYRQYMYSYPHKTAYRPVDADLVRKHLAGLAGETAGLYVHIPFCRAKCGYCNLFSVGDAPPELVEAYLAAVERQLEQLEGILPLRSVEWSSLVLGGGTPGLLHPAQLGRLLEAVRLRAGVSPWDCFSAIELSPSQADDQKVAYLAGAGFSRVSLGVQSFVEAELRTLGRPEPPGAVHRALRLLKKADFALRNLDLIYGIPGQTAESLRSSLEQALDYAPDEVFLYPLYIRPYTPLEGCAVEQEHCVALYRVGRDILLDSGYRQISMRRFTRADRERAADCGFEQGLALGCGGRSYLGNLHVCEPYAVEPSLCAASLRRFVQKRDFPSGLTGYLLDEDERRRRYAVQNLLHTRGIERKSYRKRFYAEPEEEFPFLQELYARGWAEERDGAVRLTEEGLERSDGIGPLFVSSAVARRSRAFYEQRGNSQRL